MRRMGGTSGGGGLPALPNLDDFSTNTISSYTATQDSGSPAWAISGGNLGCSGSFGTQAILRRNGFSAADCSVEIVSGNAHDSGLVARFQNQSNFYLLTLSDDSGVNPSQNLRLFKRVSGTFTQLGSSVDISWSRGTSKTIRLTLAGTSIIAYVDGVSQISVTDSSIASAGSIGVRSNFGANDIFASLGWG